jgi:hypothetical protein
MPALASVLIAQLRMKKCDFNGICKLENYFKLAIKMPAQVSVLDIKVL